MIFLKIYSFARKASYQVIILSWIQGSSLLLLLLFFGGRSTPLLELFVSSDAFCWLRTEKCVLTLELLLYNKQLPERGAGIFNYYESKQWEQVGKRDKSQEKEDCIKGAAPNSSFIIVWSKLHKYSMTQISPIWQPWEWNPERTA
jgi:hypothetical protein